MHGDDKKSKIYGDIEIQTLVTNYKFPPKFTPRSIALKVSIDGCTRKDAFRSTLLQGYINEGWEKFAQKFAIVELCLYLSFVILITIQFWQTNLEEAMDRPQP